MEFCYKCGGIAAPVLTLFEPVQIEPPPAPREWPNGQRASLETSDWWCDKCGWTMRCLKRPDGRPFEMLHTGRN